MADPVNSMVAALQIGRTYSGYAFSFTKDCIEDPLKIQCNRHWNEGGHKSMSLKTSTCLLLDKNREFVSFGYDAENKYAECSDRDNVYFFLHFTMEPQNKKISHGTMLEDVAGKILPAFCIFQLYIKALTSHLTETLETRGICIEKDKVLWVLTVPACWTYSVEQFMRSSAMKAGIHPGCLVLVPEAASAFVYCQTLLQQTNSQNVQVGTEYMVVNLGGFTADTTVIERKNYQLIENYHTTGNSCGSTLVNKQFYEVFVEILGESAMKSIRNKDPLANLDFEREFELYKRTIEIPKKGKINLYIPRICLDEVSREFHKKDFQTVLEMSSYASNITLMYDKIRIDADTFRDFFKSTIDNVISLMEKVLIEYKQSSNVMHIVMVGGFAECSLVQDAVKNKFPSKHIIIMKDASMVAVKGAVICGYQTNLRYIRSPSHDHDEMKAAQSSVKKCIFCDNPGIYHCTECKSAFCQPCRTKHDKLPTTKTHTVTDLKKIDSSAFSTNAICVSHKSEIIYFCTRCHVLICGKCVTTDHKGHDITDIKTVADDCRRSAEENISDLKVAVTKLSKLVGQMKEIEKPTIKRSSETTMAEIDTAVKKIMKAVSFTKESKLDDVQSQLNIEIEEFQYDLKNKERIYEHQKNIYESLERLMNVSHDITFITSYETLKRDIHDISDFVRTRGKEKVYTFDKKVFVQEVVNAIVSDFEMSLVGKEDGSVVLMHKTDIKKTVS